jgi:hypothetical protein
LAVVTGFLAIVHRPGLVEAGGLKIMKDDAESELAIFTEATRLPILKRGAFLDIACHGDQDLRKRVDDLLKAHDRVGNFMEEPPTGGSIG